MTDLSPERLEKLLERYDGVDVHLFNIASRKIDSLAPDLARQRIADAKRIAELKDALGRISGLNDLSEAADDEIEAVARSKLHECELVARAALKDSQ